MMIPEEVPIELADRAVPLEAPGPGQHTAAWARDDALAVIASLRGTKVAIEGGEVYRTDRLGLRPAIGVWSCDRLAGETATDYAERSRNLACGRIEATQETGASELLYAFVFSDQQDAA